MNSIPDQENQVNISSDKNLKHSHRVMLSILVFLLSFALLLVNASLSGSRFSTANNLAGSVVVAAIVTMIFVLATFARKYKLLLWYKIIGITSLVILAIYIHTSIKLDVFNWDEDVIFYGSYLILGLSLLLITNNRKNKLTKWGVILGSIFIIVQLIGILLDSSNPQGGEGVGFGLLIFLPLLPISAILSLSGLIRG